MMAIVYTKNSNSKNKLQATPKELQFTNPIQNNQKDTFMMQLAFDGLFIGKKNNFKTGITPFFHHLPYFCHP
jgi:hypothetical protein